MPNGVVGEPRLCGLLVMLSPPERGRLADLRGRRGVCGIGAMAECSCLFVCVLMRSAPDRTVLQRRVR